jgi:hypothetical protein
VIDLILSLRADARMNAERDENERDDELFQHGLSLTNKFELRLEFTDELPEPSNSKPIQTSDLSLQTLGVGSWRPV